MTYQVGGFYTPGAEGGLRHDDPRLGLDWPLPVSEISPTRIVPGARWPVEDELRRRIAGEAA